MPANLPPQYFAVEQKYREAKTEEEKIKYLKEMFAIMPKHKGTEHLQGDIKNKIAKLKKEIQRKKKVQKKTHTYHIPKEGAAQIVLLGAPNAGKSQIIKSLTNANPEVGDYPFTTLKPQPAMMPFENIKIQLVDTPPITSDFMEPWITSIIRNADAVLMVVDLQTDDGIDQIDVIARKVEQSKIIFTDQDSKIDPESGIAYIKTMLVANKDENDTSQRNLNTLKKLYADSFPIISVSAQTNKNLKELRKEIFLMLNVIRVYTKEPGKKADYADPIILKIGGTVLEAALAIHKDFAFNLKYARVWGGTKYEGQMVNRDYVLMDGDVIEFHI